MIGHDQARRRWTVTGHQWKVKALEFTGSLTKILGAGDGDRTRLASLEVWMSRTRGQRETPYFDWYLNLPLAPERTFGHNADTIKLAPTLFPFIVSRPEKRCQRCCERHPLRAYS
jgi:hypothetical protein